MCRKSRNTLQVSKLHLLSRYNESKALNWLESKVNRLLSALNDTCIYIPEEQDDCVDSGQAEFKKKQRCAWGMIGEYLNDDIKEKLKVKLNISSPKRKVKIENCSTVKLEATEDYSKGSSKPLQAKDKSLSRTDRALQKIDKKGMKSISSFFTLKSKH